MNLSELRKLVRQGEHSQLEFKRKAHHPDKIAREMVAFTNSGGGVLLIGVGDDGRIYGSKTPMEDEYVLSSFISKHIFPSLPYSIARISISSSRKVLLFNIKESKQKPHYLIEQGGKRMAYIRSKDMSVRATYEMKQFLRFQHREKGVSIAFGEVERNLLVLLEDLPHITLNETRRLLKLSRKKASSLLILLLRAGLLKIKPSKDGDYFSLSKEAFEER